MEDNRSVSNSRASKKLVTPVLSSMKKNQDLTYVKPKPVMITKDVGIFVENSRKNIHIFSDPSEPNTIRDYQQDHHTFDPNIEKI